MAIGNVPLYLAALDECGPDEDMRHVQHWTPYETLQGALTDLGALELIPKLVRDFPRARRPESLAYSVAVLGAAESVSHCVGWLRSENDDVRRRVLEGARDAASSGSSVPSFRTALYTGILQAEDAGIVFPPLSLYETLLALDRERAVGSLRKALDLRNPELGSLLRVLGRDGVQLDPGFLLSAYRKSIAELPLAGDQSTRINWKWVRHGSMRALCDVAPGLVIAELEQSLEAEDPGLRGLAVELLIKVEGLKPIYRDSLAGERQTWSREELVADNIAGFMLLLASDGLDSLHVNRDPPYCRGLIPDLREIGAIASAQLIEDILRLFLGDHRGAQDWPQAPMHQESRTSMTSTGLARRFRNLIGLRCCCSVTCGNMAGCLRLIRVDDTPRALSARVRD